MKSWTKPTDEMVDKALKTVEKVTERRYFFSRLENPLWFKPLIERGCFKYPPKSLRFDDGTVQYPYWPEMQYLKNVCREAPDEVIKLLIDLPEIDNPAVYDGILDIALQLPGEYSVKIKGKILEYIDMDYQIQKYKFANLLTHWTKENQTSAAIELTRLLVPFEPDPESDEKQKRRKEDPMSFLTLLRPAPRLESWIYRDVMLKGVYPLAEKEPYEVACLLIHTTANMIRLRTHQEDSDIESDFSESWCPRLQEKDREHRRPERILVDTLTFACMKVFEKSDDTISDLDKMLRKQKWKIFTRLRHHLYAQYPNQKTKPWIQKAILTHETYNLWVHTYEFQQMLKCACEHFGDTLLTKEEWKSIFDAILDGPSKENYRHWVILWLGEGFTEERFQERKQHFHRMQLRPFESVLFGEYAASFKQLQDIIDKPISDDSYPPYKTEVRSGGVSERSPRTPEDLSNLTDKDLLEFINEWEKNDEAYENNSFVRTNIEALANAFQTIFRESIIPDTIRFKFWMDNRDQIERPIYIRVMIYAMQANVKVKNFDQLNEWLTFCEWVLSHPDREHDRDYKQGDESRENQNWTNARRAVGDFIGVCLEKDVDIPITVRRQIAKILRKLCTQYDWNVDENDLNGLFDKDPLTEGMNNTRSRALDDLIKFGFWLRRHEPQSKVPEVTTVLPLRFSPETDYPLTLPEYAILGKNYLSIYNFHKKWAIAHKPDFFPQNKLSEWAVAFSSFVLCNGSDQSVFKILENDYSFALQHLDYFKKHDRLERDTIVVLGQSLFTYYLWDVYPLKGEASLLERFYQKTDKQRDHWGNLFNDIGHRLWNTPEDLDQVMKDRVIAFFDWRFNEGEPSELKYFTVWLQAECLDVEWRLKAYSKVLDVCQVEDWGLHFKTLCEMLPDHTPKVIECFLKLTKVKKDNFYILLEEAKTILNAGLNSTDERVCQQAVQARDNLLREGRFDLLDLEK